MRHLSQGPGEQGRAGTGKQWARPKAPSLLHSLLQVGGAGGAWQLEALCRKMPVHGELPITEAYLVLLPQGHTTAQAVLECPSPANHLAPPHKPNACDQQADRQDGLLASPGASPWPGGLRFLGGGVSLSLGTRCQAVEAGSRHLSQWDPKSVTDQMTGVTWENSSLV